MQLATKNLREVKTFGKSSEKGAKKGKLLLFDEPPFEVLKMKAEYRDEAGYKKGRLVRAAKTVLCVVCSWWAGKCSGKFIQF